jgi:D-alanyl-D-alanine carboxypeptidase
MDYTTGEIIQKDRADLRRYPASLTKVMTLYLVFEKLKKGELTMDFKVKMSRRSCRVPPSKLYLRPKDHIGLQDAIFALSLKSANDVATALAENIAGSEKKFAEEMNKKAKELGMTRTHFVNASGLPHPQQLSTATDMAIMAKAMIQDHPEYLHFFNAQLFQFRGRKYRNHNKLLGRVDGVYGMKTGYTRRAGWNIIATYKKDGKNVIGVVMGEMSANRRDYRVQHLLEGKKITLKDFERLTHRRRGQRRISRLKNWSVQVGVFRNKRQAERFARQLAEEHREIIKKDMFSKLLNIVRHQRKYKTRFTYKEHKEALEVCDKLKENGTDCFVIKSQ